MEALQDRGLTALRLILAFTLLIFRSSNAWVYYEGGLRQTGPRT
jgi:hypothetical protein